MRFLTGRGLAHLSGRFGPKNVPVPFPPRSLATSATTRTEDRGLARSLATSATTFCHGEANRLEEAPRRQGPYGHKASGESRLPVFGAWRSRGSGQKRARRPRPGSNSVFRPCFSVFPAARVPTAASALRVVAPGVRGPRAAGARWACLGSAWVARIARSAYPWAALRAGRT